MADDWQPGDLALCVAVSHPAFDFPATSIRVGVIYTVEMVGRPLMNLDGERALDIREVKPRRANHGWPSSLFRKIRPHTPDAEDAETIRLLTGAPVREPAL